MHFTNFAILLAGDGGGDGCGNTDEDYTIMWLSLAFVALALILVVLLIAVLEFKIRYKKYQLASELHSRLISIEPSRV